MKKLLIFALSAIFVIAAFTMDASAAKKSSKKMSTETIDELSLTVDAIPFASRAIQ